MLTAAVDSLLSVDRARGKMTILYDFIQYLCNWKIMNSHWSFNSIWFCLPSSISTLLSSHSENLRSHFHQYIYLFISQSYIISHVVLELHIQNITKKTTVLSRTEDQSVEIHLSFEWRVHYFLLILVHYFHTSYIISGMFLSQSLWMLS